MESLLKSMNEKDSKILVIISSKNPTHLLIENIHALYNRQFLDNSNTTICVVDSNSDDFRVYDTVKKMFPKVEIYFIKNKNYEYGAYKYGLSLYPDHDIFICIQDSFILNKKKIILDLVDDNNCYTYHNFTGFDCGWWGNIPVSLFKNSLLEIDINEIKNDKTFCLATHNSFIVNNVVMKDLFKTLNEPPICKGGSCAYERIFGLYFIKKKVKTIDLRQYVSKINGKRS